MSAAPLDQSHSDKAGATVTFLDLVRFTSLTDIHGDTVAADAATALEDISRAAAHDGTRLVKSLGDGVLLVSPTPAVALRCAATTVEGLHDLDLGLDARGGLHHGPVVERDGDVFGSTVNLAARLADVPAPGRLAMTRFVALAAGEADLTVKPLGFLELRGLRRPVEVFEADACAHDEEWITDPVCGMRIRSAGAVGPVAPTSERVGFCSRRCAEVFATDQCPP